MVAGLAVAAISAACGMPLLNVLLNLALAVLAYALLRLAEANKRYYLLCSRIVVIVVFIVTFPILFFTGGGYRSGTPSFFLLAIVFTVFLLERLERAVMLTIEFAVYIACCLVAYYKPETVFNLSTEFGYMEDVVTGFVVTGVLLMVVAVLRSHMFHTRQAQIQELNRELEVRNETLARYDRMKSDFLATVAHELNTPLAVIAASSSDTLDLLKETPLDMDEIIENQLVIERRVKLIDNILLDLMDTVAIENGRLSLNRQPVDLSALIKNVCDVQFKQLNLDDNRITYKLQPGLPHIWVDSARLEQVMTNLLANSARYTKGGEIIIRLRQSDNGAGQTVSVTDDGEGMDEEMARIVLKQYVSTKADYWRHGIGLFICRRIIMAHGGDIQIDSAKGRGTTISFTLLEEPEYE